MNFDYKLLGRKLAEARQTLLMNVNEVAEFLGCSEKYYNEIENGEIITIDGDTIVMLSNLFERDFRYFVSGDFPSAESQIKELFW